MKASKALLFYFQVQAGKALNIKLFVSEHYPEKLGKTVAELDVKHAAAIYSKTKFSMIVPEILDHLKQLKEVENIVLMGLETHICLEQTAMDLLSMEKYTVHVIADCALSRVVEDRKFALKRLEKMGCIISTSENLLFKLMRDKNHPKFNEIRKLVSQPSVFPSPKNKL